MDSLIKIFPGIFSVFVLLFSTESAMCQKEKSGLLIYMKDTIYKGKAKESFKIETKIISNNKDTVWIPLYSWNSKLEFISANMMVHFKRKGLKKYNTFNNELHHFYDDSLYYKPLSFSENKIVTTNVKRNFLDTPGDYKIKLYLTYYLDVTKKLKRVAYSNWIYITVE